MHTKEINIEFNIETNGIICGVNSPNIYIKP
jgi:hypothetical protein